MQPTDSLVVFYYFLKPAYPLALLTAFLSWFSFAWTSCFELQVFMCKLVVQVFYDTASSQCNFFSCWIFCLIRSCSVSWLGMDPSYVCEQTFSGVAVWSLGDSSTDMGSSWLPEATLIGNTSGNWKNNSFRSPCKNDEILSSKTYYCMYSNKMLQLCKT